MGASLGIGSGTHTSSVYGKSLAEDLGLLLELAADALRRPTFPLEQVERLRGEMLTRLAMRDNNTRARADHRGRIVGHDPLGPAFPQREGQRGQVHRPDVHRHAGLVCRTQEGGRGHGQSPPAPRHGEDPAARPRRAEPDPGAGPVSPDLAPAPGHRDVAVPELDQRLVILRPHRDA